MKRPAGWETNPQAMAAASQRSSAGGHPDLVVDVDRDTWLTPRFILEQLGSFDLDPCAAAVNPAWVCDRYYTTNENGLSQEWKGRVFLNPPFSNTSLWLDRHSRHADGISLVPATIESVVWRRSVWKLAHGIFFMHGRTRFCNPDGSTTTGRPLRSIALIAWTTRDLEVLKAIPSRECC